MQKGSKVSNIRAFQVPEPPRDAWIVAHWRASQPAGAVVLLRDVVRQYGMSPSRSLNAALMWGGLCHAPMVPLTVRSRRRLVGLARKCKPHTETVLLRPWPSKVTVTYTTNGGRWVREAPLAARFDRWLVLDTRAGSRHRYTVITDDRVLETSPELPAYGCVVDMRDARCARAKGAIEAVLKSRWDGWE